MTDLRLRCRLSAVFVFLAVTLNAGMAFAHIGAVTKVQKQAQVGATPAIVGTQVDMFDVIQTGAGARLQITFEDGTELTLGEDARVVVDRYVYDPGTSTGALALDASQGAFRFVTGKLGEMRNKDVTVATPSAALAVRGTGFWAGFIDLQYGVLLLSETGKVDVSNEVGTVTLENPGEGTDIAPPLKDTFAPNDPYYWPEDKVARALASTSFGLALGPGSLGAAAAAAAAAIVVPLSLNDNEDRPRPASP